ncbi:hypothetical protein QF046_001687 [Microbacterium sp. W4I4]|uniref:hypothetical protein n=1 Tax=Microbacterium sp. W4I4 TaxID=3042295 RepID=UPI00277DDD81|nr:hypothetical protein [Microbacterium sp. W4I4]MDQ0614046.1 hypothetical protein [Microbacterium sp. W4I4]
MAEDSAKGKAWALFDTILDDAAPRGEHSNPWQDDGYVPDMTTLERLLGAALQIVPDGKTQSGVAALALDVWVAYELRRAGFHPDAVWPRAQSPRVVPTSISTLLDALPIRESKPLRERLEGRNPPSGVVGASANVLGKNYIKQVDVVMSAWDTGPQILISTKRMDSSFGKNAANRVEESYGDAKNLRGRHPLAALGFVFGLRSTAFDTEPATARWIADLLEKLGREDDAYDGVCLLVLEYGGELTDTDDNDSPALPVSGPVDDDVAALDVSQIEVDSALATLPVVRVRRDLAPPALDPARFLNTMVEHVLDITPITLHREARIRAGRPFVESTPRSKL